MGNLGFGELLLIFLVLLLVFGTSRLPALGDALGKGIRNFKRGVTPEGKDKDALPQGTDEDAPKK
jgi:sec-independent protein translocase protein TatA